MKKKKVCLVILALALAAMFTVLVTGEVFATDKIGKLPDCTEGQIAKVVSGEWACADEDTSSVSTPIIWSGGCDHYVQSTIGNYWEKYCTNLEEFYTAQDFLSVASDGTFTVLAPGFYRINAYASSVTYNNYSGIIAVRVVVNGVDYPYYRFQSVPANSGLIYNDFDVIWPFEANDTFYVEFYAVPYRSYNYYPSPFYSRIQVSYQGPPPTP